MAKNINIPDNTQFIGFTFSAYKDFPFSLHRAGCGDVLKEVTQKRGMPIVFSDTLENALDELIDPEMVEMGFTHDDVKVYNCCKGGK